MTVKMLVKMPVKQHFARHFTHHCKGGLKLVLVLALVGFQSVAWADRPLTGFLNELPTDTARKILQSLFDVSQGPIALKDFDLSTEAGSNLRCYIANASSTKPLVEVQIRRYEVEFASTPTAGKQRFTFIGPPGNESLLKYFKDRTRLRVSDNEIVQDVARDIGGRTVVESRFRKSEPYILMRGMGDLDIPGKTTVSYGYCFRE